MTIIFYDTRYYKFIDGFLKLQKKKRKIITVRRVDDEKNDEKKNRNIKVSVIALSKKANIYPTCIHVYKDVCLKTAIILDESVKTRRIFKTANVKIGRRIRRRKQK